MRHLPPGVLSAVLAAGLVAPEIPPTASQRRRNVGRSSSEKPYRGRPRTESKEKARRREQIERGIIAPNAPDREET